MSQRIHDPTESGMPECSTTGTLRETLEELKESLGKIRDAASEMITEIEAKLNEMEKAPELAAVPETAPEMAPDKAVKTSGKDARQMAGREDEKSSVLKDLTAKKTEPKDPGRSRKKPARREEAR